MKINFLMRSQTKISPTKAVTYPRHFFVDREIKKIKGSWDKFGHQGLTYLRYTTTHSKQLQVIEIMGKIKLQLKRSIKGIYIVEIWM